MKALHGILFFLAISCCLLSCSNNDSTKVDNGTPTNTSAPTIETHSHEEKSAAQSGSTAKAPGSPVVESTERLPDDVVDDKGVSYQAIAKGVCACGSKYIGKDEQTGDVLINKGDEKYKEVVDCSIKKKQAITKTVVSRQKLVRAIKAECSSIPGTLVMSLILALEKS